ncbi:hypothetical protein B0I18_104316 [Taibaiella chishuiensis]|uniref:Uncharacterized protein n=1 Tax=Taibaiella chishuiensis TaxID=1434707 RepID=A0A2P8D4S9_9BACT|nr:hypothetical protein B0I18_104316 [Taibaiella chishuiensis]
MEEEVQETSRSEEELLALIAIILVEFILKIDSKDQ